MSVSGFTPHWDLSMEPIVAMSILACMLLFLLRREPILPDIPLLNNRRRGEFLDTQSKRRFAQDAVALLDKGIQSV